jgi:hypothetical protein
MTGHFGTLSDVWRSWQMLPVMAASLLMATACRSKAPPEAVPQTVQVGTVQRIQPDTPQRYSAAILPNTQADLAFKSPGLIETIHQVRGADGRLRDVQPGDRVIKGTELATVRPLDYRQKVEQGQASIRQAGAQFAAAKAASAVGTGAAFGHTKPVCVLFTRPAKDTATLCLVHSE